MSRKGLMDELRRRGVSNPERICERLDDDAIVGVLRWATDEQRRGAVPSTSALYYKLKGGGLNGYGAVVSKSRYWLRWALKHTPDLAPSLAASAADMVAWSTRRKPTAKAVRERVLLSYPADVALRSNYPEGAFNWTDGAGA